ncbi:MAG TPA: hypothetical protein VFA55_10535 [Candidatus Kapabacteria bacterium]|nr:hypothetical protein [Candidatus Kapabacteria bacterium]
MMNKLLFLLPVILFIGSCKSNNPITPPVTNVINVNDTLTATVAGQNWSASAFRLDSADLNGGGYINGYELTGSGAGILCDFCCLLYGRIVFTHITRWTRDILKLAIPVLLRSVPICVNSRKTRRSMACHTAILSLRIRQGITRVLYTLRT